MRRQMVLLSLCSGHEHVVVSKKESETRGGGVIAGLVCLDLCVLPTD